MALVPLIPTCYSSVDSIHDACIIIEACLQGYHNLAPHRAYRDEHLARNGYVYVYEQRSSEIKLWQDDVVWGPAEPLRGFLVYEELQALISPGRFSVDYRADMKKVDGLVKKTFTAMVGRVLFHLVAYSTKADGAKELRAPALRLIVPCHDLIPIDPDNCMPWNIDTHTLLG